MYPVAPVTAVHVKVAVSSPSAVDPVAAKLPGFGAYTAGGCDGTNVGRGVGIAAGVVVAVAVASEPDCPDTTPPLGLDGEVLADTPVSVKYGPMKQYAPIDS